MNHRLNKRTKTFYADDDFLSEAHTTSEQACEHLGHRLVDYIDWIRYRDSVKTAPSQMAMPSGKCATRWQCPMCDVKTFVRQSLRYIPMILFLIERLVWPPSVAHTARCVSALHACPVEGFLSLRWHPLVEQVSYGKRCLNFFFFFFISIILVQLRLHKEFLVSRLPVEELLSTILTLS